MKPNSATKAKREFPPESVLDALFDELNNAGRWGGNDELGTLNYITPQKRIAAASLVRTGRALSLARDLDTLQSPNNPSPVRHTMCYQAHYPIGAVDALTLDMHGFALTHLDAIAHVYRGEDVYNGRKAADIARKLSPEDMQAVAGNQEIAITRSPKGAIWYLGLNQKNPNLAKKEFRRALTLVANRPQWLDTFYQQKGFLIAGPAAPDSDP